MGERDIQQHWEALHARMLDLEQQMRRVEGRDDGGMEALRDQWRFVMMEISEIEEVFGPMSQRRVHDDVHQTNRERVSPPPSTSSDAA